MKNIWMNLMILRDDKLIFRIADFIDILGRWKAGMVNPAHSFKFFSDLFQHGFQDN